MRLLRKYSAGITMLSAFLFICFSILIAEQKSVEQKSSKLQKRLEAIAANFNGTVGVAIQNIETGETARLNADELFPMASVYKIPIMVEVFQQVEAGRFSLHERIELTEEMKTLGSGILTLMDAGLKPTIQDLITLMIIVSDNEATDILLQKVGAANVTATMKKLGLKNIRVDRTTRELIGDYFALMDPKLKGMSRQELRKLPKGYITPAMESRAEKAFSKILKDVATPEDMTALIIKIYKGEAASPSSCKRMLNILGQQQFNTRLPRYLPEETKIIHKTGTIGSTTNDAGIIFLPDCHIAITVFTKDKQGDRIEAERIIARVAQLTYDYFDFKKE
jgi:beta-lactamase class A